MLGSLLDFVNIQRKIEKKETNIYCKICESVLFGQEDVRSSSEKECCYNCENDFKYRDVEKWKAGVRPTSLEIKKAIEKRDKDLHLSRHI